MEEAKSMLKETYSWALRRVFRFALRRALGRALKNDLDVNQLDVALGAGTLELRDLVLDCDYLTRQLGHESLRVEEGRVGWVRATIPWNALGTKSCVVEVGDVDLVLAPREDPIVPRPGARRKRRGRTGRRGADATGDATGSTGGSSPQTGIIDDGVQLISKALENVLKGLRARAVDVTVRVDARSARAKAAEPGVPSPSILARFRELDFRDDGADGEGVATTREKVVSVEGLEVDVVEDAVRGEGTKWRRCVGGGGGAGVDCVAAAKWSWRSEDAAASFAAPDAIAASLTLSRAWVETSPARLEAVTRVATAFQPLGVEEDEPVASDVDDDNEFVSPESSFLTDICDDADSSEEEGIEQVRQGMRVHMSQYLDRRATERDGRDSDEDDDEVSTELTLTIACPGVTATAVYDDAEDRESFPTTEHACMDAIGIDATVSSGSEGVSFGLRVDGLGAREYLRRPTVAASALGRLPNGVHDPFEPSRRGELHRAPLLSLAPTHACHDGDGVGAATFAYKSPGRGGGSEPRFLSAALAPALIWIDAGLFERTAAFGRALDRARDERSGRRRRRGGDGSSSDDDDDDDDGSTVGGGWRIAVNAALARVVACAPSFDGDGSHRCVALDIVHDRASDAAPAFVALVPSPDDDAADETTFEFADVVRAAFYAPPTTDRDRTDADEEPASYSRPLLELESLLHEARREGDSDADADTRRVAVSILAKGGGGGLALGGARGTDDGTACLDAYRAVKARADLAVDPSRTHPRENGTEESDDAVRVVEHVAAERATIEIDVTSPRIALAASPESIARAAEAFAAFAALPRDNPLSCAPPAPGTPIPSVAFRASAGEVVAGVWTDWGREAGTRIGGGAATEASSVMMHGAASAMFQSAMSFLRESTRGGERAFTDIQWGESMDGERVFTDGSVPPARAVVDAAHGRRDLRGATVSLANARVFSATAVCGDPGANLLTVNAEGFDLTRGVRPDPRRGPALTARDHDALKGEPGLTVVHVAAPGVGGAAYASVSGAVAKIARGRGVNARDAGVEVVLEDLRTAATDVVAAAASRDDPGKHEDTLPYHASLDVRESAVALVGVVRGDGGDATLDGEDAILDGEDAILNHGVVRLDVLRVAVIPGESTGSGGVGSESPRHPASRGPPLKHSALVEGIAVHVARPRAIATSPEGFADDADVNVVGLPGFPCTSEALAAANVVRVARETAVRAEARTGGGCAALVALNAANLRCDFHGDSLNATLDLFDAMTSAEPTVEPPREDDDEDEERELSSLEASPPRREFDNAPAAAAALSQPSVRVAAGHAVLDDVDEDAFVIERGDGCSCRAKSPRLAGGVIEDYASISKGADRKARERAAAQRLRSSRCTPPKSPPPPLTIAESPSSPTPAFAKSYAEAVSKSIRYVSPETAATEAMRAMRLSQSQSTLAMGRSGTMMGSYMASSHLTHAGSVGLPPRPPRSPKPTGAPKATTRLRSNGTESSSTESSNATRRPPPRGGSTEHRAVWFDGGAGVAVIDDHVSIPPTRRSREVPGAMPTPRLPEPPRDGSTPTSSVTALVSSVEVNARSGSRWSPARSSAVSDVECAGARFVAKGAALRCDELVAGSGGSGSVAWRAAASIADAACVDLTPPPRCRWPKIFAHDATAPRETDAAMLRLDVSAVRMDPAGAGTGATELRLRVALLPVHLRLDQHALRFFQSFASRGERVEDAGDDSGDDSGDAGVGVDGRRRRRSGSRSSRDSDDEATVDAIGAQAKAAFFQLAEIRVPSVRLDYVPRDVDVAALRAGNLGEALNLVPFGGVVVRLQPVTARGVCGWSKLSELAVRSWLEHVASTQAHKFASGLAPIRSVCNVGTATRALVTTPLEFRRAGRRGGAWRGAAHGAAAFVKAVSREALGLGVTVAAATNAVIGGVEDAVIPRRAPREEMPEPNNLREGVRQAATTLGRGLKKAAAAVKDGPVRVRRLGGDGTAVMASAVRSAPTAAVAPVAAAAEAVHRTLLGARNQFESSVDGTRRGTFDFPGERDGDPDGEEF